MLKIQLIRCNVRFDCSPADNHSRMAFTLIELLVVIAIVGVLVGMLLPAVQMVRESARRTSCANNFKQIALAVQNYESARKKFPAGITSASAQPYRSMTWLTQLLPYLEQTNLWDQAVEDYRLDPSPFLSHLAMRTPVNTFACPSDPDSGKQQWTHQFRLIASTNYLGSNGTNYLTEDGVFGRDSRTRTADISDGTSYTILAGERPPSPDFWYGWWYAGNGQAGTGSLDMLMGAREINGTHPYTTYLESCPVGPYRFAKGKRGQMCDTLHWWSFHPGGAQFAFCDGSIRFLGYSADEILPQMATRAGSEVVAAWDE